MMIRAKARPLPASGDPAVEDKEFMAMISNLMSTKEVEWISVSAAENPVIFNKLFEYSFTDDRKLAFRSSWILSKVCDKNPELFYPCLSRMIEALEKLENESTLRSFLRITHSY